MSELAALEMPHYMILMRAAPYVELRNVPLDLDHYERLMLVATVARALKLDELDRELRNRAYTIDPLR